MESIGEPDQTTTARIPPKLLTPSRFSEEVGAIGPEKSERSITHSTGIVAYLGPSNQGYTTQLIDLLTFILYLKDREIANCHESHTFLVERYG